MQKRVNLLIRYATHRETNKHTHRREVNVIRSLFFPSHFLFLFKLRRAQQMKRVRRAGSERRRRRGEREREGEKCSPTQTQRADAHILFEACRRR